jgi:hypothetical protein
MSIYGLWIVGSENRLSVATNNVLWTAGIQILDSKISDKVFWTACLSRSSSASTVTWMIQTDNTCSRNKTDIAVTYLMLNPIILPHSLIIRDLALATDILDQYVRITTVRPQTPRCSFTQPIPSSLQSHDTHQV